eukprot:Trichotokara_eunicae@DN1530_c0_g1_i3.p1
MLALKNEFEDAVGSQWNHALYEDAAEDLQDICNNSACSGLVQELVDCGHHNEWLDWKQLLVKKNKADMATSRGLWDASDGPAQSASDSVNLEVSLLRAQASLESGPPVLGTERREEPEDKSVNNTSMPSDDPSSSSAALVPPLPSSPLPSIEGIQQAASLELFPDGIFGTLREHEENENEKLNEK